MVRQWLGQILIAAAVATAGFSVASAQSSTEGPLADPNAAPPIPAPKSVHPKPALSKASNRKGAKTARHAPGRRPVGAPADAENASNASARAPGTPLPEDPVSFGMKWNGSNDNAQQTRVQNYNGDAQGTGAEVGLKLHF